MHRQIGGSFTFRLVAALNGAGARGDGREGSQLYFDDRFLSSQWVGRERRGGGLEDRDEGHGFDGELLFVSQVVRSTTTAGARLQ